MAHASARRRARTLPLAALAFALVALVALVLAGCGEDAVTPPATATPAPDPTATVAAPAASPTPDAPRSITVAAVGDISLARRVVDRMEEHGMDYPYALVAHLLDADITIGNLEGALTERGEPWPKGFTFRTPPRFAPGLRNAGFDFVSLANNHTMDYGAVGLADTIDALDAAGVAHAGAGPDAARAYAPVVLEADGLRVAFLSFAATPDEFGGFSIHEWAAGPGTSGLAIGTPEAVAAGVAAAREVADFVVVIVHAGFEYADEPGETKRALAAAALDAGADAFIAHHAHVVQAVEMRGNRLIAWDLGNFVFHLDEFDLANIPVPRVSLVLRFELTEGEGVTGWEALPVVLDEHEDRPRPATDAEAEVLHRRLAP
jgi:poly-gamma-glutamate capsule biosynthesis protein CapA/YwtB (metallophosphatase superfamily)